MRLGPLALCMLSAAGCNSLWIDPMKIQPKLLPYAPSTFYPDGLAMRRPPPGTVAQEAPLGPTELLRGYGAGPDGGFVGAFDGSIPIPVDAALLARGREHFDVVCAACHGPLGDGLSVVASKMSLRPPPSLLSDRVRALPDGRIFEVIGEGYGLMPPHGALVPWRDRWAIVAYVRALELSQRAPLALLSAEDRRRLSGGQP